MQSASQERPEEQYCVALHGGACGGAWWCMVAHDGAWWCMLVVHGVCKARRHVTCVGRGVIMRGEGRHVTCVGRGVSQKRHEGAHNIQGRKGKEERVLHQREQEPLAGVATGLGGDLCDLILEQLRQGKELGSGLGKSRGQGQGVSRVRASLMLGVGLGRLCC